MHVAHLHLAKPQRRAGSVVPLALARSKHLNGSTVTTAATASFQPMSSLPRAYSHATGSITHGGWSGKRGVPGSSKNVLPACITIVFSNTAVPVHEHTYIPQNIFGHSVGFSWSSRSAALPRIKQAFAVGSTHFEKDAEQKVRACYTQRSLQTHALLKCKLSEKWKV